MSIIPNTSSSGVEGYDPEYTWEVATLYPAQGAWTEADYLDLTDHSNRRIEFAEGRLEFLSMPTEIHESLVQFLLFALHQFVAISKLGKVYSNGIRVRVRPDKVRLPDVLFLHKDNFAVRHNRVWDGADLVMEVVSDDTKDRRRDYEDKLVEYAAAGIAEYWIVDYERRLVIVHHLVHHPDGGKYEVGGEYGPDQQAASHLLAGFAVDVAALFAAADDVPE